MAVDAVVIGDIVAEKKDGIIIVVVILTLLFIMDWSNIPTK